MRQDGRRADHAADAAIALVVELVVRQIVLADVVPQLPLGPVGQRRKLEHLAPGDRRIDRLRRLRTRVRLVLAQSRDPDVHRLERADVRLHLANLAAIFLLGLAVEEQVLAVLLDHPLHAIRLRLEPLYRHAVPRLERIHQRVRLRVQAQRVHGEHAQVRRDPARQVNRDDSGILKTRNDAGALAVVGPCPAEQIFRAHRIELIEEPGIFGDGTLHRPNPRPGKTHPERLLNPYIDYQLSQVWADSPGRTKSVPKWMPRGRPGSGRFVGGQPPG